MYKKQNQFLKTIRYSFMFSTFIWLLFLFVVRVNNFDFFHSIPNTDSTNIVFEDPKFNIEVDVTSEHEELLEVNSDLLIEDEVIVFKETEDVASGRIFYDNVPLMYQTDYPNVKFSGGTVATDGCGISCAAMAISYLTDSIFTPDMAAIQFDKAAGRNDTRMEAALDYFDIKYYKEFDYFTMKNKIKEGHLAIILVNEMTAFTGGGHFILATGTTEDGRILINDPYEPNYSKDKLEKGFEIGFEDWEIIVGCSGGWVIELKEEYQSRINWGKDIYV